MFPLTMRIRSALSALLVILTIATSARAQTSGANGTHDPSRLIESEGRFYVYSTGGGSKSSPDGLVWTEGPALFPAGIPSSTTAVVSNNEGVWAPDVIFLSGQYYLYYAIANTQDACAIGLVTSPTLNPSSPDYKWTDRGLVVSNTGSDTYCAIDPCPQLDASGNLWLTWGSGYSHPATSNTIWVTLLDNTTGLPSSADSAKPGHPLEQGHIEASYVYYHDGYYYLFWNSGGCCDGASSTYEIHMARSQSITGPYGTSSIFLASHDSIHGPGQIGIYDQCGADRFTYHYYPDTGGSVLGENELTWDSDGWPVAGAESTTPLTPCSTADAGSQTSDAGDAGRETGSPESGPADSGGVDGSYDNATEASATDAPSADATTTDATAADANMADGSSEGVDGALPGMDAGSSGTVPKADSGATSDSGASSGAAPVIGSSAGCSCSIGRSHDTAKGLGSLFVLGLAMVRRRSRSTRRREPAPPGE